MPIKNKTKVSLFDEVKKHFSASYDAHDHGKPRIALQENNKALAILKKIEKILLDNAAIYELNDFLVGNSNITRPKK
jgi:hypothetical protein